MMSNSEIKEVLYRIIDIINYAESIAKLPDCNDCQLTDCVLRPKPGQFSRINCGLYVGAEEQNNE